MSDKQNSRYWSARIATWRDLSKAEQASILQRSAMSDQSEVKERTATIVADVRARGDAALRDYTQRFDGYAPESFRVSAAECEAGLNELGESQRLALIRAADQIKRFHAAEMPEPTRLEVSPGVVCQRVWRPLTRVGLYVPAGTAPLPSTGLMLAIPAQLAGCRERIICTPAARNGKIHPGILAAARISGITDIYKVGGAQAIAALAYGTESVPKVDKIFGPGNAYVTQAKAIVAQDPSGAASDLPAGPSEVLVVMDESANPVFAAADLLSQAEHGNDSHVVLVALSETQLRATIAEVDRQLESLPRREIALAALSKSAFILAASTDEALQIANQYAPEHLILQLANAANYIAQVEHAGSVFIGPWSPEAVGDYASGTNHVLPTYGLARGHGGLSMESFMKSMTVQELSPRGLRDIGPVVDTLAVMEGLEAHARAVRVRLAALAAGAEEQVTEETV